MNTTIPVTVIGRPLAARAFVGCDLIPGMEPIDLRAVKRYESAHPAVEGRDYLPGTYVERWHA